MISEIYYKLDIYKNIIKNYNNIKEEKWHGKYKENDCNYLINKNLSKI